MKKRRSKNSGETGAPDLVPTGSDLVLVPVDSEGTYLLFGDPGKLQAEISDFAFFPEPLRKELGQIVATSIGAVNVGAQLAYGISQACHLVRLAPQTLQALQTASPVVKDGWNLGTLQQGGQFVQQVRWLPAGPAGAAAILASVGPAVVLLAIQWQLGKIESLAREAIDLGNTILKEFRSSQLNRVFACRSLVLESLDDARQLNAVTPAIWEWIQGQGVKKDLLDLRATLRGRASEYERDLRGKCGARERSEWIEKHAADMLRDIDALVGAEQALYLYHALFIGHLVDTAHADPRNSEHARIVGDRARDDYRESSKRVLDLLTPITRRFGLMSECPGGMGFAMTGRSTTPQAVKVAADRIRRLLGEFSSRLGPLENDDPNPPAISPRGDKWLKVAALCFPDRDVATELRRRLRWILNDGEDVITVVAGSICPTTGFPVGTTGFLVGSTERALLISASKFARDGEIMREAPLAQVDLEANFQAKPWPTITIAFLGGRSPEGFLIVSPLSVPESQEVNAELRRLDERKTALAVDTKNLDV
jgi:hypothetical protein